MKIKFKKLTKFFERQNNGKREKGHRQRKMFYPVGRPFTPCQQPSAGQTETRRLEFHQILPCGCAST